MALGIQITNDRVVGNILPWLTPSLFLKVPRLTQAWITTNAVLYFHSLVKINITSDNISQNEWPRSSQHLCLHCCHLFRTVPVLLPVWHRARYHLSGNYCSWNCAKSYCLDRARAHTFPSSLTALALFAYQISYRGKHCRQKTRAHPSDCPCHSRYHGLLAARPKETLQAFGGHLTIQQYRQDFSTIESYAWITRFYSPGDPIKTPPINPRYLYTLDPIRKTIVYQEEDDDPVVFIQSRLL